LLVDRHPERVEGIGRDYKLANRRGSEAPLAGYWLKARGRWLLCTGVIFLFLCDGEEASGGACPKAMLFTEGEIANFTWVQIPLCYRVPHSYMTGSA
jgi:hypothetical protein